MSIEKSISDLEFTFLALGKLAEEGLARCRQARESYLLQGLTPPTSKELRALEEQRKEREASDKYTTMLRNRCANRLKKAV